MFDKQSKIYILYLQLLCYPINIEQKKKNENFPNVDWSNQF